MKKFIALLAVFILCFNLSYTQPVRADTFSIPFSAIPDLLNAFYTVASGGKIEFSALIGDMTGIDDFWQNLHDYYDTHYTQPLLQSTQGLVNIGLSGLALDGINSIDSVNNLSIPITPQDLSNFMGYDINWVNNYADPNTIVVNPDIQFQSFLDVINKRDNSTTSAFWFYNYPITINESNTYSVNMITYPITNYSWFVFDNSLDFYSSGNTSSYLVCSDILDIYITQSSGIYSFTITATPIIPNSYGYDSSSNRRYDYFMNRFYVNSQNWDNSGFAAGNPVTFSYSGSLGQVLQYICNKMRNVNIYVDGELWSYVNDNTNPAISLNDYTDVGDTGNITYGVFPLNSTGDIGLDLAKWGEYIYNQCISGIDSLSMDTVIDDGWDLVDTEDGERAITQDDEEDVAKVINGFVGTTATTPTPTPDIGDPPVLKIIPPILELPDEIWPDGGRDTTVLAQIIHSTDVIMPDDIMTILWSIIGILVIGGLLTILHK